MINVHLQQRMFVRLARRSYRMIASTIFLILALAVIPAAASAIAPVIEFVGPADGLVVGGEGNLNATAKIVSELPLTSVTLTIDDAAPINMAALWGVRYAVMNTSEMSEGAHQLLVTATDNAGNISTSSRTLKVDRTNPVVAFHQPTAGATVAGTKQVVAKVTDVNWQNVTALYVDGHLISKKMPSLWGANYFFLDTTDYVNGAHTLTVKGLDKAGHTGTATTVVSFNNDTALMGAPKHTQVIEAESSNFINPFKKLYGNGSTGGYIHIAPTAGVNPTPSSPAGTATFQVNVPHAAFYRLMARSMSPSEVTHLYVAIDGGVQMRWPVRPSTKWEWDEFFDPSKTANPAPLSLAAGAHTIKLTWGSPGFRLDTIALSSDRAYSPALADRYDNVGPVWAADRVQFDLLTTSTHQFIGYYDANQYLIVQSRPLSSRTWTVKNTGYKWSGYDSHRYIDLGIDKNKMLHVSADMHANMVKYWRASKPNDVTSLAKMDCMLCNEPTYEARGSYPSYYVDPAGDLIFKIRHGVPADADIILSKYNATTKTWTRMSTWLSHAPDKAMGPYPIDPVKGPDGKYHVVWVYRTAKGVAFNRTVMYAKSSNLKDWTRSNGAPLTLPITINNAEIVDPVLEGGGLVNGQTEIGFAPNGSPLISYHKFNGGLSAIYVANLKNGKWVTRPVVTGNCQWYGGANFAGVRIDRDGYISQDYEFCDKRGRVRLNPTTFEVQGTYPEQPSFDHDLLGKEPFAPLTICGYDDVETRTEIGESPTGGTTGEAGKWVLRWHTLATYNHFDLRPNCTTPEANPLRLYKLKEPAVFGGR